MRTIAYLGSTTGLDYERELLAEWGKRDIELACALADGMCEELAATGTDGPVSVPVSGANLLGNASGVVLERGSLDAASIASHPNVSIIVILDDENASVDVEAATRAGIWVAQASNRTILQRFANLQGPTRSTRRHALMDALAGIAGERPMGRVNEL